MVAYSAVQACNSRIPTELASGLVAVFVGATSGIGEYTLKAFVKYTTSPRVYLIGRSQDAADRIQKECKPVNPNAELTFMKVDVSLIRNVDAVCQDIKRKERAINILCVSQGTLYNTDMTDEGLRVAIALAYYSRIRFMLNLLPLLQAATGLRRVLSIFAGGKEGSIDLSDIKLEKAFNPFAVRGHVTSMMTFTMETLAMKAPTVSFIHDFPGRVRSNIARDKNMVYFAIKALFFWAGPFVYIPNEESGERHVFYLVSAMYPAVKKLEGDVAVALDDGLKVSKGCNGEVGSGVYTPDSQCDPAPEKVEKTLAQMRRDGLREKVWKHTENEFERMTGKVSS